jgi:hypothetical protein
MFVPRSIAALASHTDPGSSRYALGGIRLERDSEGLPHAVATDGRRLAHVTWSDVILADRLPSDFDPKPVSGFETMLPTASIAAVSKAAKPGKNERYLSERDQFDYFAVQEPGANGKVELCAYNSTTVAREQTASIEGRFPKWRDVIPQRDTKLADRINCAGEYSRGSLMTADEFAVQYSMEDRVATYEMYRGEPLPEAEREDLTAKAKAEALDNIEAAKADAFDRLYRYLRDGAVRVTFDPDFVAEACKLAKSIGATDASRGVEFVVPFDASKPMLVEKRNPETGARVEVVIMPLCRDR